MTVMTELLVCALNLIAWLQAEVGGSVLKQKFT